MLVKPMIGGWEPPRITRIASAEARRLVVLPVAGLSGDLHQDLGRNALTVELEGSLLGDEARDQFLADVRAKFLEGAPVDFVADIVKESELEQVLIVELDMEESASLPDTFSYRIVLREYTEPPEPPGFGLPGLDVDLGLDLGLDLEALDLLDLLDLPALAADIPPIGDLLSPVQSAAEDLKSILSEGAAGALSPLEQLFGGG